MDELEGVARYIWLTIGTVCLIVSMIYVINSARSLYYKDGDSSSKEQFRNEIQLDILMEVTDMFNPEEYVGTGVPALIGILTGSVAFGAGYVLKNSFLKYAAWASVISCAICFALSLSFFSFLLKLISGKSLGMI